MKDDYTDFEDNPFSGADVWGRLKDLPPVLPDTPTLPAALIPEPLRAWIMDAAERAQLPPEFIGAPAMVTLSAVLGRKCCLYPKRQDSWAVVPNLWGGSVARPGMMKSPAIQEATAPIRHLVKKAIEQFEHEKIGAETELQVLKIRQAAAQDEVKNAIKKKEDVRVARQNLQEINEQIEKAEVTERRYITSDPTTEKLGELLRENPNGILVLRDELYGFLRSMDKMGHESDRAFYLESWSGLNSHSVDRIGRGSKQIPALCVSILGSITPGKLESYVSNALEGGSGDDGLLQRFQLMVWSDPGPWKYVDRAPDAQARERAFYVFEEIDVRPGEAFGAQPAHPIPGLRFTDDAQVLFEDWYAKLERRIRSPEGAQTPAFEAHLSKYRSLMPSLALIFHIADIVDGAGPGPVSLKSAQLACAWCDFLASHARRIYAPELQGAIIAAQKMAERIQQGDIEDRQTVRQLYRHEWGGLKGPTAVNAGLDILRGINWIKTEIQPSGDKGGRPAEIILIHPELQGQAA